MTSKCQFDHDSSASSEQPRDDNPESGSERGVASITIEDDNSTVSDDIDDTQQPLGDISDESPSLIEETAGLNYQPQANEPTSQRANESTSQQANKPTRSEPRDKDSEIR